MNRFERVRKGAPPNPAERPFAVLYWKEGEIYFTPIQPEMTMRWTSEVPS